MPPKFKRAALLRIYLAIFVAVMVALGACGGGSEYSAAPFRSCLDERGANPAAVSPVAPTVPVLYEVSQLARRAAQDNGAIEAFGAADETFPEARATDFLFFDDGDAAERGADEIDRAIGELEEQRDEAVPYATDVRRNVLIVSTGGTDAQERVIDECLERSEE